MPYMYELGEWVEIAKPWNAMVAKGGVTSDVVYNVICSYYLEVLPRIPEMCYTNSYKIVLTGPGLNTTSHNKLNK